MVDVILGCCRGDDLKPKVTLQIGKIIGSARETSKGTEYVSFVGIPYAEPPIGNNMLFVFCSFLLCSKQPYIHYPLLFLFHNVGHLRFRRPVPVKPWTEEKPLDASKKKFPYPIQLNTYIGYLNYVTDFYKENIISYIHIRHYNDKISYTTP